MNELAYSVRRAAMLKRCAREYVLHYVSAKGGADPDAEQEVRFLHRLKNLSSLEGYCAKLCSEVVLDYLFSERKIPLKDALFIRYAREVNAMLLGKGEADHALPTLRELYYGELPLDSCLELLKKRIALFANTIVQEPAFQTLLRRDASVFLQLPHPTSFPLGEVTLYSTALFAERRSKTLVFWEYSTPGSTAYRALFHRYYGMGKLHWPLAEIASCFLLPDGSVRDFPAESLEVTKELDQIRDEVASLCEFSDYIGLSPRVIPPGTSCANCRFRAYCESGNFTR